MEEIFDIEQYRKENPMDYLKAINLIIERKSDIERNVVFDSLYKITRVHIPEILYKYYSFTDDEELNNQKLNVLSNDKIYMSHITNFNDPFDSRSFYYDINESKILKKQAVTYKEIVDKIYTFNLSASFTANGFNSMPMWAHYSNNHQGFCVSYNMKQNENVKLRGCMFPIQYIDKRISITEIIDKYMEMVLLAKELQMKQGKKEILINDLSIIYISLLLSNIKHSSWSYENEFRCSVGNPYYYMDASPLEIYIGRNCKQLYIKKLFDICYIRDIPLFKMKSCDISNSYEMNFERIN